MIELFEEQIIVITVIIVMFFIIIFTIYFGFKKETMVTIPLIHPILAIQITDSLMRSQNWRTEIIFNELKLKVIKDRFVVVDLYFFINPDGSITIKSGANVTTLGTILVLLTAFVYIGIFIGIYFHIKSLKFAKENIKSVLLNYNWSKGPYPYYFG